MTRAGVITALGALLGLLEGVWPARRSSPGGRMAGSGKGDGHRRGRRA